MKKKRRSWPTFQSSSGVAKLMRADFSGFPVFQTRTKDFMASPGALTSSVTVFTIPPRDVALKVRDESVRRTEHVGALFALPVPVIALASLATT